MVALDESRKHVRTLLEKYVEQRPLSDAVETQTIIDKENGHYQLVNVGWEEEHRIYHCVLHIDIKDDKIWIQRNQTDHLIAEELEVMGIPTNHIVLGFHSPYKRQFTGYAVN